VTWALLAPGPSASLAIAEKLRAAGLVVGVVGCAYQLAPWAEFIASSDRAWWHKYQDECLLKNRYCMLEVGGVERVRVPGFGICNSGVLALDIARQRGATEIKLFGFDMHGSHFFGVYTNGLVNATEKKRLHHLNEFRRWAAMNKHLKVTNCTPGSLIDCFPMGTL
jgi:esterase/lipase